MVGGRAGFNNLEEGVSGNFERDCNARWEYDDREVNCNQMMWCNIDRIMIHKQMK